MMMTMVYGDEAHTGDDSDHAFCDGNGDARDNGHCAFVWGSCVELLSQFFCQYSFLLSEIFGNCLGFLRPTRHGLLFRILRVAGFRVCVCVCVS